MLRACSWWSLKQKEGEKLFKKIFFSFFRNVSHWTFIGHTLREGYLFIPAACLRMLVQVECEDNETTFPLHFSVRQVLNP